MKNFLFNKVSLSILGLSSFVILGTINDIRTKSVEEPEEIFADVFRSEAKQAETKKNESVSIQFVKNDMINKMKINGRWKITRQIFQNELKLDVARGDSPMEDTFELIADSTVMIGNNQEQVYKISVLQNNRIAVFKKLMHGYEILEASKVESANNLAQGDDDLELKLFSAILPDDPGHIYNNGNVHGSIVVSNKQLQNLEVSIQLKNGEQKSFSLGFADIGDAGAFTSSVDGEDISGIFFNNGQDGYRLSFVNGPLANIQLNFYTEQQIASKKEQELEQEERQLASVHEGESLNVEESEPVELTAAPAPASASAEIEQPSREIQQIMEEGNNLRNDEKEAEMQKEPFTVEEVEHIVNTQGFAF